MQHVSCGLWLLCLSTAVAAEVQQTKFELELSLTTHHWVSEGLYEDNQLIGLGVKGWEVASFINSFGDRSYSAGRRWQLTQYISFSAGVIHGYGDNSQWFPLTVKDEVIYLTLNAETQSESALNLRLRQLGEATMVSLVIRPPKNAKSLPPTKAVKP